MLLIWRELSTGLQLQQKLQNHTTAISNCYSYLTRRQVGAKGAVIPPILDGKYSSVEQRLL